jgi:ferric-dicitrate binding protein FerR (iron transport regulator)
MELQNERTLEGLLIKYLKNDCTSEEKSHFYELLTSSDSEKYFKEVLFAQLDKYNGDNEEDRNVNLELIYNQIEEELKYREKKRQEQHLFKNRSKVKRIIILGLSLAAIFFVAFFSGVLYNLKNWQLSDKRLTDGAFSEIMAPLGARTEIKLADGTEVILNAGSKIIFRSDFNVSNRDLNLEGEGYFKVAENNDLPLVVEAGNLKIKAVGTEFNIKAYSDDNTVETTLITGKVEISHKGDVDDDKVLKLEPYQKAIYTSESNLLTLEKIQESEPLAFKPVKVSTDNLFVSPKADVDQVTAWTKNKLIIRGEDLESICVKLQRKYNVTFLFGNEEIKNYRFSGVLLDETLEQVLNMIKLTSPVNYMLDGKTVLIFSNKERAEKYSDFLKKEAKQ